MGNQYVHLLVFGIAAMNLTFSYHSTLTQVPLLPIRITNPYIQELMTYLIQRLEQFCNSWLSINSTWVIVFLKVIYLGHIHDSTIGTVVPTFSNSVFLDCEEIIPDIRVRISGVVSGRVESSRWLSGESQYIALEVGDNISRLARYSPCTCNVTKVNIEKFDKALRLGKAALEDRREMATLQPTLS